MTMTIRPDVDDKGAVIRIKLEEFYAAHLKCLETNTAVAIEGNTLILGAHIRVTATFDPIQIMESERG